jgi:RimJ/RimL family protein N-acetyltransferase
VVEIVRARYIPPTVVHDFRPLALRPFVPSGRDFEACLAFHQAIGFTLEWRHGDLAGLRWGPASFLLQGVDVPVWQENQMLVLSVDDLDAFWAHVAALELPARFPGARVKPPTDFAWGREVHFIDPAGVCWHARELEVPPGIAPVILTGATVRLEPLSLAHVDALTEVALDEELWRWSTARLESRDDVEAYVRTALEEALRGEALPFATVHLPEGRVVGSTRFAAWAHHHRRVEIGWTWIARPFQRTRVNTEAKLLMLQHAFGALGCARVELKTDALNARSRAAITRLGATEEGTLRRHMTCGDGRVRDTVYYSITADEWPAVERRLSERLAR